MGWCYECDGLQPIEPNFDQTELRSSIDAIATEIHGFVFKALSFASSVMFRKAYKSDLLGRAESLTTALEVAQLRSAKGRRCLACGLTNTAKFVDGIRHSCGGELHIRPCGPSAPLFSYQPVTVLVDFDGFAANLPDPMSWANHLGKRALVDGVMEAGLYSGFLAHIPLPRSEFDKLAVNPEWRWKLFSILEMRITHLDFDSLVSDVELQANAALRASISKANRVAISADNAPLAKWLRSDIVHS